MFRRNPQQSVGGIIEEMKWKYPRTLFFGFDFFILCWPDHNNHYVPHRSGIVEVSIAHYYVKESDLWQGDFNIIIIITIIIRWACIFHCPLFVLEQIKHDLYKTINYIRILFISTMSKYYYYTMFVVICIILWQRK